MLAGLPCTTDIGRWLGSDVIRGRTWLSTMLQDLCPNKCGCEQTFCIPCEPGTFLREGGTECAVCLAGTADTDSDPRTPCADCPHGKVTIGPGNTECSTCEGSRMPNDFATGCMCPDGTFPEVGAADSCITCPEGSTHWSSLPDDIKINALAAFSPACVGRQTYQYYPSPVGVGGTWSLAAEKCIMVGGKLASVHSNEDQLATEAIAPIGASTW